MTKGDPASKTDTLVTYLYKLAFINGENGQAAAVSVLSFLFLCIVSGIYMAWSGKGGDNA
jgi:multiple sugar transport system permease protein